MLDALIEKCHGFLNSRRASVVYLLLACLTVAFSVENYAIPLFVLWCLFILVMEKSFLNLFLPVTLLCGFAIRTSGQSTMLLQHLWLAVPVVVFIVLHFVIHLRKPRRGKLFFAQCAVALSLLLGGLFSIAPADYFSPGALYFVLLLGLGMLLFYFWFQNGVSSNEYYDCREKLMECLYALGIFCAFSILDQAVRTALSLQSLSAVFTTGYVWSNDICELMLFAIPAPFYFARRHYGHTFVGILFFFTMLPTRSASAILAGGALLLFCLVYLFVYNKPHRVHTGGIIGFALLFAVGAVVILSTREGGLLSWFLAEENGRLALIREAWKNFLGNPVFGAGLGAPTTEVEVTFMAINWTHNFIFQVLGGLGILGALAYGYQLYLRGRLIFSRPDPFRIACGLSYLGIFLISMFQPGVFCPMPYETMAVMIFAVLEVTEREEREKLKKTNSPS